MKKFLVWLPRNDGPMFFIYEAASMEALVREKSDHHFSPEHLKHYDTYTSYYDFTIWDTTNPDHVKAFGATLIAYMAEDPVNAAEGFRLLG